MFQNQWTRLPWEVWTEWCAEWLAQIIFFDSLVSFAAILSRIAFFASSVDLMLFIILILSLFVRSYPRTRLNLLNNQFFHSENLLETLHICIHRGKLLHIGKIDIERGDLKNPQPQFALQFLWSFRKSHAIHDGNNKDELFYCSELPNWNMDRNRSCRMRPQQGVYDQ